MKLRKLICLLLCVMLPFYLASCNVNLATGTDESSELEDVDDDLENVPELSNTIKGVTLLIKGDGSSTYESVKEMVDTMTTNILKALYLEYGETTMAKSRSAEDTHNNAIMQDGWLWGNSSADLSLLTDDEKVDLWVNEDLDKADYSSILKYNIYRILLGNDVLDVNVSDLQSNSDYSNLKQSGAFTEDSLTDFAKRVSHTGIFYYELDSISEYILDYVIGQNAVSNDMVKFDDVNGNGTFDYNENLENDELYQLIKDYSFNKTRAEKSSKSEIWSQIVFAPSDEETNIDGNENVVNEKAFSLQYLQDNNVGNTYTVNGELHYSGFKNYVNTVYYVVYNSVDEYYMENHFANVVLENIDVEQILSNESFDDEDEENSSFNLEPKEYYGLVFKAGTDIQIDTLAAEFALDDSITNNVDMEVSIIYNHCLDTTEHSHDLDCEFQKVVGKFAKLTISPTSLGSDENYFLQQVYTDEEDNEALEDMGVEYVDVNEFQNLGIRSFDLTEFIDYAASGEYGEGIIAIESKNLTGCDFEYVNGLLFEEDDEGNKKLTSTIGRNNDYIQFLFNVAQNGESPIKFTFAFLG